MNSLFLIIILILSNGCSTSKDSTLLGAFVGASIGATIGAKINQQNKTKGAVVGIALGSALGSRVGFLDFKNRKHKNPNQNPSTKNQPNNPSPRLSKPQVRKIWQPSTTKGSKYIEGHFIYEIERPAKWKVKRQR